jgi:pyrimidine deaminase RibD-like protein
MSVCPICGAPAHPAWKAHVFTTAAPVVVHQPDVVVHKVANVVVHKATTKRSGDRHARTEARKEYKRQWMAKRRAKP